jgi:predicted aspartyl protease
MPNLVYSFAYSNAYTPAMPMVELGISLPKRSQADVTITALLDSGSDGTMLPVYLLDQIGAKPVGQGHIRGLLGHSRPIDLYLIKLYIGPHQLHAIRVIGIDAHEEPLVGRNVLNHLVITLNGLAGVTEVAA